MFFPQGPAMLENVMILIVPSHVKNLDLIAAILVMPLVTMVSLFLFWNNSKVLCFHEKMYFFLVEY